MQNKLKPLFFYLIILTVFFIFLEVSFFIQSNQAYFLNFKEVSSQIKFPLAILPGIIYFIFSQMILHFGYCFLIAIILSLADYFYKFSTDGFIKCGLILWAVGIAAILLANQIYFPNSKFADLTYTILNQQLAYYLLLILLGFISTILLFAVFGIIKYGFHYYKTSLLIIVSFSLLGISQLNHKNNPPLTAHHQPNVIIIGIDALRPDFLSYFGRGSKTPFFDRFLNQATVFSDAVTPLARTFPSWTGILTGNYPKKTGVRFNLPNQTQLDFKNSLAAILKQHGYETLYASDETRFSNIENKMGFDHVVTPPMGLNDFLLGTFNDFPLSNLIINTTIGKWLFPYSYGNRPAYVTYQPDSFLNLLESKLVTIKNKPLMLAIHFCLPHWPYLWADLPGQSTPLLERYQKSITRVDLQIRDLFSILKSQGLLEQAIVVVLSDHGEALELDGDRITESSLFQGSHIPHFYPPSLDKEKINQSAGHGTDVLGLSQYHSLLAFKLYGLGEQKMGVISDLVTLLDIKPTLLDLLNFPRQAWKVSLANLIRGQSTIKPLHEDVFLESDFTPASMRTVYPEMRKVALEGMNLFQINPKTTRVTFKEDIGQKIIQSKQFADIHGDWILALYPQDHQRMIPILVNLKTGKWTNDLDSSYAFHSPAKRMLLVLKQFFGTDLENDSIYPN